jgi:ASC-1-like (ASCH) protein/dephospho-CoA kinase
MEYTYNILNDVYYWMLSGEKTIEVRLLKEKSNNIQINDYITFNNQESKGRYIKTKIIDKVVYDSIEELIKDNDINKIMPNHFDKELIDLLNQIYGDNLINSKLVAFTFEYITSDLDIEISNYKEPYIKELTKDKIINLTGQSGSGKSYYAKENFSSSEYEIVDTDDVFSEKRFSESIGLNRKLGEYFRNKYKELPNLSEDFDMIYNEIINYCKNINKTIVIDCAQFHCCNDISILKGKIIIIRTDIDTCYNRVISRWIESHKVNNLDYTEDELSAYKERKKGIFKWYKYSNEFIRKIDCLNV